MIDPAVHYIDKDKSTNEARFVPGWSGSRCNPAEVALDWVSLQQKAGVSAVDELSLFARGQCDGRRVWRGMRMPGPDVT